MKRLFTMAMLLLAVVCCHAQSATQIFDRTVAAYKAAGAVSANYRAGSSHGTIVMKGNQFRILANNIKSWYDGKTQWTYSTATDEVNVTTPTAQQLVMIHPLAAAQSLKSGYKMSAKKSGAGYVLTLKPRQKARWFRSPFMCRKGMCSPRQFTPQKREAKRSLSATTKPKLQPMPPPSNSIKRWFQQAPKWWICDKN